MARFETAYVITAQAEGGYANNSKDAGGETYKGISRKYHPKWEGWTIVDIYKRRVNLHTGQVINDPVLNTLVKKFYLLNFWNRINGDDIKNQDVANIIYDFSVNSGGGPKIVQRVLIAMGKRISSDGVFGPATIAAINSLNPATLFNQIKKARIEYIEKGVKNGSIDESFLDSLINRVDSYFPTMEDLKKKSLQ